jgi:NADH-quinone oxidoreductase subunit A
MRTNAGLLSHFACAKRSAGSDLERIQPRLTHGSIVAPDGSRRSKQAPFRASAARSPMSELLLDYLPLVVFIGVSAFIGLALLVVPFIVAFKQPDPEKLSAYECGFNAFDDARMKFDVRFYLVAILFIIFDLEVAFLFPWAVAFKEIGVVGFWSMMVFLGVLTVGFIYEWRKGALEWD